MPRPQLLIVPAAEAARGAEATGSNREAARRAFEYDAGVLQFVATRRRVEDEGPIAGVEITLDLFGDPIVATDQVRADGLVVLERHQPVRVLFTHSGFAESGELVVPGRIGNLHRQLVGELALPVFRETRAGN